MILKPYHHLAPRLNMGGSMPLLFWRLYPTRVLWTWRFTYSPTVQI